MQPGRLGEAVCQVGNGVVPPTLATLPMVPPRPGGLGPKAGGELVWTLEYIAKSTPSRADGYSDKAERAERFAACSYTRNMIRGLISQSDKELDETRNRVQVLACYYIQLFFMFVSLRQEDRTVVAVAAAFLACKVADVPRRMKDLLKVHNQQRTKSGEAELGEEEQTVLRDRLLKVEFLLLRIIRFDFDLELPLEKIDRLADLLLVRLATSQAFKDNCKGRSPHTEASALRPKLLQVAKNFTLDALMGFGTVLVKPIVVAAAALVIAVRYVHRGILADELYRLLEAADSRLERPQLERAVDEIFNVYRTKNQAPGGSAPAAPNAGDGGAGAVGSKAGDCKEVAAAKVSAPPPESTMALPVPAAPVALAPSGSETTSAVPAAPSLAPAASPGVAVAAPSALPATSTASAPPAILAQPAVAPSAGAATSEKVAVSNTGPVRTSAESRKSHPYTRPPEDL